MICALIAIGIGAGLCLPGGAVTRASRQPSPVSLALLYDSTMPPMAADVRSDLRLKLILNVVAQSLASQDTVQVGFVAGNVSWTRTFGGEDRSTLYSEVVSNISVPTADRLRNPALCDGLYEAVDVVAHDQGRRAVVAITDGRSAGNIHSFDELVAHAREAHVSLSAVHAPWPGNGRGWTSPEEYLTYWSHFPVSPHALLTRITSATGGSYLPPQPRESGDLKQRLRRALDALHQ
jgi:hypothetical protein